MPAPRRIAITGAPGAGKTTLIDELARRGWTIVPEAARAILQRPGGMDLRIRDPLGFAFAMLDADKAAFEGVDEGETAIFDRGLCDIAAFLRIGGLRVPTAIADACRTMRFDQPVLRVPAWESIYRQDAERIQTFEQAVESDRQVLKAWRDYGYDPLTVPLTSVGKRADWVEDLLSA